MKQQIAAAALAAGQEMRRVVTGLDTCVPHGQEQSVLITLLQPADILLNSAFHAVLDLEPDIQSYPPQVLERICPIIWAGSLLQHDLLA